MMPTRIARPLDYQVNLDLMKFDSDSEGNSILTGRWSITDAAGVERASGRASYSERATASGYQAMAATISRNLGAVSRDIAAALNKLPPSAAAAAASRARTLLTDRSQALRLRTHLSRRSSPARPLTRSVRPSRTEGESLGNACPDIDEACKRASELQTGERRGIDNALERNVPREGYRSVWRLRVERSQRKSQRFGFPDDGAVVT